MAYNINKPLTLFFGYPMLDLLDKKYTKNTLYSFNDILLLKNEPFYFTEKSIPSITSSPIYNTGSYDELMQYGHIYSKRFNCATIKDTPETHIIKIFNKSLDYLRYEVASAISLLQGLMLLMSVYSSDDTPVITRKLIREGVTPYDL